MAEIYCPFESINTGTASEPAYDRAITAEDERTFNKLRYTNGVFSSVGSGLSVSANNNMTVTVGTGGAHIEGALYYNSAPIALSVEAADAVLNRIDRVVLQFNTSVSVRSVRVLIRTGTAATNPVAPELRRESNLYEIALADVYVGKGKASISQSAITDQRLNSALCGFVVAAIPSSVDTTGLFDQYQTALNEWLDTVAAALDNTLAGNLQNQITALGTRLAAEEGKIQDIEHGGTGATTAAAAREAILENKALSIAEGGTGKTTAAEAVAALGINDYAVERGETAEGQNGYIKCASGMLIQWGKLGIQAGSGNTTGTIQFLEDFINTSYCLVVSGAAAFTNGTTVAENIYTTLDPNRTKSKTTVSIYKSGMAFWHSIYWIAIGKWK